MRHEINTSDWKEFRLGDLFEFATVKQAKSQQLIPTLEKTDANSIPYVVQSKYNNMVSRYVDKQWLVGHNEPPVMGNALVLGVTLNVCSYQADDFGASQVITARSDKLNVNTGTFLAAVITNCITVFNYQEKPGLKKYERTLVKLPATPSGNPDWDFMNAYMSDIMYKEHVWADELVSRDFSKHEIDVSGWKEYKLSELFDVLKGHRLTKANMVYGDTNFIGSSAMNNGITEHISNNEHIYDGGVLTVCYNGSVGATFYQDEPFWASDDVNILKPKQTVTKNALLFVGSVVRRLGKAYDWVDKWTREAMLETLITLPAALSGDPDWDSMDVYMSKLMNEEQALAGELTGLND